MMTEELMDLRGFTHLGIIHRKGPLTIYRLLYPDTVAYLEVEGPSVTYIDRFGSIIEGKVLEPLMTKVRQYERLFSRSLMREDLDDLLRLDEVRFLLTELNITNPRLEQTLSKRLYQHLEQPYVKRFHQPLVLPKLITRHEFVVNYLQTNIGLPEESDNYYNKLREMIEQIEEQIAYVEPDYFKIIRALLLVANQLRPDDDVVVLSTSHSHCLLIGGTNHFPPEYGMFTTSADVPFSTIDISNSIIFRLFHVFQELE